eukprot:scaffold15076_cov155-Amphora_coffeaeformis.AAC.2
MIIPTSLPKPKASGIDPYHARRRRRNPSLKPKPTAKAKEDKDNESWDMETSPQKNQVSSLTTNMPHDDLTYHAERRRRPQQALGFDTRLLVLTAANDDHDVQHEKEKARDLYQILLQGMTDTGVLPSMIVSTATEEGNEKQESSSKNNDNDNKIKLERQVLHTVQQLEEMQIQPIVYLHPTLQKTEQPSGEFPKQLLAKSTWKIVRGLGKNDREPGRCLSRNPSHRNLVLTCLLFYHIHTVDTICQDKRNDDDPTPPQPLDVTLVMRASSLVGDREAQIDGLEGTVEHLRTYFDNSKIQSLRLVLIERNYATLENKANDDETLPGPTIRVVLEKALEQKLGALSAAGIATANGTGGLPLDITIQAISDNAPGQKKLMRHLMLQSMEPGLRSARISIDLPETAEGMQCQLLLDASYNILATSLQNKSAWDQLAVDLQALSGGDAPLQVLQLVPYSAFDASLLFGVPLRLSASAQTPDWQDYQTMKILFGALLRILQERGLVLLLQVPENTTACGVWLGRPGQCLALMARETQGSISLTSPQTALLWGYSTDCQWLRDDGHLSDPPQSVLDDETTGQLNSYVDSSLETVLCAPYNPFLGRSDELWNVDDPDEDAGSKEGDDMDVEINEDSEGKE